MLEFEVCRDLAWPPALGAELIKFNKKSLSYRGSAQLRREGFGGRAIAAIGFGP